MKDYSWVLTLILILTIVFLIWDDVKIRQSITNAPIDTTTHIRFVNVAAPSVDADSLPAVLELRRELSRTRANLDDVRWGKALVESLYAAALEESDTGHGSIELPVASLDTLMRRDSLAVDTLRLTYVFPPANAFEDIHLGLSPFRAAVTDSSFRRTVAIGPGLFEEIKNASWYIVGGILLREIVLIIWGR